MPAYEGARTVGTGPLPGLVALSTEVRRQFGGSDLGIFSARDVCGNAAVAGRSTPCDLSLHAEGRAADIGYPVVRPTGDPKGNAAAAWLVKNADRLGVQEVIWAGRRWTSSRGWVSYSGRSDHFDHVHVSMTRTAAGAGALPPGGADAGSGPATSSSGSDAGGKSAGSGIADALAVLTSAATWIRVAQVLAGMIAVAAGLAILNRGAIATGVDLIL